MTPCTAGQDLPTARAVVSWLCALWGRHEGAPGGAPLAGVWGVRGWALSLARPPVLGACGRGPLPTGCACGGRGREDSSPTPQRALLRAGCACCRGGTGAPLRGLSFAVAWDVRGWALSQARPPIRFGPPRPPVAILSPPCCLPVAVLALSAPCRSPVACLSLPCRCPVAPLSLSCRFPVAFLPPSCCYPVASCRFLSFPVAMLLFVWRLPVALLSLSCRSLLSLSCRYFLLPPCCPPVACLSSSCRLPVASLSPPCRLPVAQRGNLSLSCRLPVACLSLACRLPAASLSPPCRLPVASLSPNVVTCRSPVACLSLACRLPVAFLSPPCCLPVASLSPNVLPHRWKAIDTSNRQFDSTKNVLCSCQIVRSHLSKPPQTCAKQ